MDGGRILLLAKGSHLKPRNAADGPYPEVSFGVNIAASRRVSHKAVVGPEVCEDRVIPFVDPTLCAEPHVPETVPHHERHDAVAEILLRCSYGLEPPSAPEDGPALCGKPDRAMLVLAN